MAFLLFLKDHHKKFAAKKYFTAQPKLAMMPAYFKS
jgi:hypothetical protein